MQGQQVIVGFVTAFTGSHCFVLDYLTDEVVRQPPEAVQQFLLHACILERLCGPLCDTVTGGSDSQSILEQLERANLFMVPLDNDRHWYLYHLLFADYL